MYMVIAFSLSSCVKRVTAGSGQKDSSLRPITAKTMKALHYAPEKQEKRKGEICLVKTVIV